MSGGGRVDGQTVIRVLTLVCGLLGSLLAGEFWEVDLDVRILVLLVGTVIGTALALLLTTDRPEPRGAWAPPGPPGAPTIPQVPATPSRPGGGPGVAELPRPGAEPVRSPQAEPAKIVIPLSGGSGASQGGAPARRWWAETPTASAPAADSGPDRRAGPARDRTPAPPMSTYDSESALVAQCPRCGEFRLDVSHAPPVLGFRCRNATCGNTWEWRPGTPWPPVVVRRNLRDGAAPGGAVSERG